MVLAASAASIAAVSALTGLAAVPTPPGGAAGVSADRVGSGIAAMGGPERAPGLS
jgi:hypothetical protein